MNIKTNKMEIKNIKRTFPLYKNDGISLVNLTKDQKKYKKILLEKINSKELRLVKKTCICGNTNKNLDVVITEKDRYGIPVKMICCSRCGLIRSDEVFDEKSNELFYTYYYRPLYSSLNPDDNFFQEQYNKGEYFIELIRDHLSLSEIENIAEIGCGAGGILLPFKEAGKNIQGVDFGEDYIKFGQEKGLNLQRGGDDLIEDESIDLLILSHVMEHYLSPLSELQKNIQKVKKGKYLLIEVPGIFCIAEHYYNPLLYFQNAHVYNYYGDYLVNMFEQLGLETLYMNERCTFICRKKENKKNDFLHTIDIPENISNKYPVLILSYLYNQKKTYEYRFFNINVWKRKAIMLAKKMGYKKQDHE